jgi:hypothetical protein
MRCNYGAEMMVSWTPKRPGFFVNVRIAVDSSDSARRKETLHSVDRGALRFFGRWACPEIPQSLGVGASRNASQCDKSSNSEAGRKFFSKGLIDTVACDRDVFDIANAICSAHSDIVLLGRRLPA